MKKMVTALLLLIGLSFPGFVSAAGDTTKSSQQSTAQQSTATESAAAQTASQSAPATTSSTTQAQTQSASSTTTSTVDPAAETTAKTYSTRAVTAYSTLGEASNTTNAALTAIKNQLKKDIAAALEIAKAEDAAIAAGTLFIPAGINGIIAEWDDKHILQDKLSFTVDGPEGTIVGLGKKGSAHYTIKITTDKMELFEGAQLRVSNDNPAPFLKEGRGSFWAKNNGGIISIGTGHEVNDATEFISYPDKTPGTITHFAFASMGSKPVRITELNKKTAAAPQPAQAQPAAAAPAPITPKEHTQATRAYTTPT